MVTKVSPDLKQLTRYEPGSVRASDAADADQDEGPAQVGGVMVRSDFGWCSYRQTGKSQELVSKSDTCPSEMWEELMTEYSQVCTGNTNPLL